MSGVRTATVESFDGVTLFTRTWKAGEPVATMVVGHGAADHSGRYQGVGEFFSERGFDVVAFDLRGHGSSEGPVGHVDDFEHFVEDLEAVVEREARPHDRPSVLYGHSMGGLIALGYLTSDREQPSAAVLGSPALGDSLPGILRFAAGLLGNVTPRLKLPVTWKSAQLSRDPAVGAAYENDPLVWSSATCRLGKEGFRAQARLRDELDAIRVPTLVIHGSDDEIVPPEASAPLAGVEGVDRKLYPGLRHELHNEPESAEVLGEVYAWLGSVLDIASR